MEIFVYGDSHAHFNFRNIPHHDFHRASITMHRIGRDNIIINFDSSMHDSNSIIVLNYGEVDCRNHIRKQIEKGREEETVIEDLVTCYFETVKNNVSDHKHIIIVAVVPPTEILQYESVNGPITHEYPFVGTNSERVRYTERMNALLQHKCSEYEYIFFDPLQHYKNENGCLKRELSDSNVHVGDTTLFLQEFDKLLTMLQP